MGKEHRANCRLLTLCLITFVACSTTYALGAPAGNVYVRAKSDECSKTKLIITLVGMTPLPRSIVLSIRNDKTGLTEVESANIDLQGDEYVWTGLIQLGSFTAIVFTPGSKTPLESKFTNIRLLLPFRDGNNRLVQLRSGGNPAADGATQPPARPQNIPIDSLASSTDKIHLLLIGTGNKLAAQYLGAPIPVWTPTVPDGPYKIVVIEYDRNGHQCRVNSKKF